MKRVDISFYGTVYNSARYIKSSLMSIIETALELRKHGITSEIVITDNYSSDGTWEIMSELKKIYVKKGLKIKLIRYKCSRGLGRNISLRFTHGEYLFFISDFDIKYNARNLTKIITNYISQARSSRDNICFYIFLTPRSHALHAGGIHDLNRTEDIEFGARLLTRCIMLPVLDEGFKPIPFSYFMKDLDFIIRPRTFITTYSSERRYVKDLKEYIKREFRNKIDMICGMGYTWKKIFYEAVRLHRLKNLKLLIWIAYHLTLYVVARLLRRRIYSYSDYINNGSFCDITMFLNYIALMMRLARIGKVKLSEVRELVKKILQDENKVKTIQYYLALYPEALQEALKGYYFMVRREV
jgi:hypothetical protein